MRDSGLNYRFLKLSELSNKNTNNPVLKVDKNSNRCFTDGK